MPKVSTFTDKLGNRGKIGTLVYHWMVDAGGESTYEVRRAKAKRVTDIWTQGAGGTKIMLEGERDGSPAKDYVILEEGRPDSEEWETPVLYE